MDFRPQIAELKSLLKESEREISAFHYVPVTMELPADAITPVSAFLRLRSSGSHKMFLLESAEGGEQIGRYSFLGLDPFASLKGQQGKLVYEDFQNGELSAEPLSFAAIGEWISRFRTLSNRELPPFMGGALGYLAYDTVSLLEDIPRPEGSYGEHDCRFMFFKRILVFDRLKHRLILVHLIEAKKEGLEERYEAATLELRSLHQRLGRKNDAEELLDLSFPKLKGILPIAAKASLGKEAYLEAVKTIKAHIRAGDIFQCVLSDRFEFPVESDSFLIYRILRMINPSPYLYYLEFGDETLLGASPEMLIRTKARLVETCPIAGTRPRGKSEDEDLKMERDLNASVKEKAEHLMLVDLGRNDIGRVSQPGTVKVSSFMKVERYSHVMHLVSRVQGQLAKGKVAWDALASCFPAGTLSGAPKIKAMKIISALEGTRRGPYGGAIVVQDFSGDLNTCITIRSLHIKDGKGYAQAGAGIVADSKAEMEYEEVLNKAKAIRTAVAAAKEVEG